MSAAAASCPALCEALKFLASMMMGAVIVIVALVVLFAAGLAGRGSDTAEWHGPERRHRVLRRAFWDVVDLVFHLCMRLGAFLISGADRVRDAVAAVRRRRQA